MRGDAATPPLPVLQALPVALVQEVKDSISICVQWKRHEECVEEIQTKVADLHQTLQQALQVPTVDLCGSCESHMI